MTNTIPLEPLASAGSVSTPAQFEAQLTDIAAPLAGEAVPGCARCTCPGVSGPGWTPAFR